MSSTTSHPFKSAPRPPNTTIQKRPLLHPPIPAYDANKKTIYISSSTPFMSATKKIQKHLSGVSYIHRGGGGKGRKPIPREPGQLVEVCLKATGKAIDKALQVAVFFSEPRNHKEKLVVIVRTGTLDAVDDVVPAWGGEEDDVGPGGGGGEADIEAAEEKVIKEVVKEKSEDIQRGRKRKRGPEHEIEGKEEVVFGGRAQKKIKTGPSVENEGVQGDIGTESITNGGNVQEKIPSEQYENAKQEATTSAINIDKNDSAEGVSMRTRKLSMVEITISFSTR